MKSALIAIILSVCSIFSFAKTDSLNVVKGDFYYISLRIERENRAPSFARGYATTIPIKINIRNLESFLCEMYSQMIYTIDIEEGVDYNAIVENRSLDSNDVERIERIHRVVEAWTHFGERKRITLADSSVVFIEVIPFTGELLKMPKDKNLSQYLSVNPKIPEYCYKVKYIYYLKEIFQTYPFDICRGLTYTQ